MKILNSKYIVRGIMLCTWMVFIFGFLYSPLLVHLFPERRTLNLLIWPTMLDAQQLAVFEKEMGVRLYVSYYESNEELLRKLQMTKGEGYDLIIAADTTLDQLIPKNIFQRLDKKKIPFFNSLRPSLLGHYFDPENSYSIPYYLGVYGLGIDKDYFGQNLPAPSWATLFEKHPYKVTMTDDPRKALLLAGYYLFGSIDNLAAENHMHAIASLLIKQKKWVELYSDIRGEDVLASKSCPVALTLSSDLWRMSREYKNLTFVVPQEGSFMIIDSCVIPAASKKQELVYQLLNFIYKPDIIGYHTRKYGFCPPLQDDSLEIDGLFCPSADEMKKLDFFRNVLPKEDIDKVWVAVMAE